MTYASRKDDHVRLAVAQQRACAGEHRRSPFDDITFVHHALRGTAEDRVSPATEVGGARWRAPLYINAMTGGSARTGEINRALAIAARETGVAIASGSMSAYLADDSVAETYRVLRRHNPDGYLIANVNAHATPRLAARAIDLLRADALQIHVNAVQEIVMPEGDRDFSAWPRNIAELARTVGVPVIVKEVGFGISGDTVARLADLGVRIVDVSGRGGTDFASIENARRPGSEFGALSGWGQSTAACLIDAAEPARRHDVALLASGGVRTPLDVVRSLALGARAVGVAGHFLSVLEAGGVEALIAEIDDWLTQIRQVMVILGADSVPALAHTDVLLTGELAEHCRLRGIDPAGYARRSDPARLVLERNP
ncbi:type 2 isopentenyl-diphosphate Delta-isomerase [Nocardia blacklockiae]|uniref:type 2 isopentenyl-diphosphate Delta-isomerase n=1 Tax=Nocardia blacklockiae TaxID=480036 RepID=UPI001892E0C5|nr:type 2 isopentenyl-diphosphate Delta-isomerase [Nocardia blacklockiae]MBF6169864.1 type 2 isopentenyl-diphosphate Delta-isomerase [Nocardia blacklockiae]